jgi:hypothetical protein
MPISSTTWSCRKCRKRFRSFRDAENCEIGHIASEVTADFRKALGAICNSEPKNKSPKEPFK